MTQGHAVSGGRLQKDHQHFPLSMSQIFFMSERQQGRKQRMGEWRSLLAGAARNKPAWLREGAPSFRPRRVPQRGASASGGSRCPPSLAVAAELAEKEERVVVWSCEAEEEQGNDEEHRDPPVTRPGCIEDDS